MNDKRDSGPAGHAPPAHGMSLTDIYYILFRHKWMIICLSLASLLAAAVLYAVKSPIYNSEAELLVRYVPESRLPSASGNDMLIKSPDTRGENILNSEVEILTSLDLALKVVDVIGAEKILAKTWGGKDPNRAAAYIKKYVTVDVPKRTDVLRIVFQHPNKDIVQPVLTELIANYKNKQAEIHRDLGSSGEFLVQRTAALSTQLAQTAEQLRTAQMKIGVMSLDEAKKAYTEEVASLRQKRSDTQAELAEREAALKEMEKGLPEKSAPAAAGELPVKKINEYKAVCGRLGSLHNKEQELLTQFTEESTPVKVLREQISATEDQQKRLEQEYPKLADLDTPAVRRGAEPVDVSAEMARVAALRAKLQEQNSQLDKIIAEAAVVNDMAPTITELQRKYEQEAGQYSHAQSGLEMARFDEALGAAKLSNISVTQEPSAPYRDFDKYYKKLGMVAVSGLIGGLVLAFLLELYVDQTLKRPFEVETRLRLPLFLSIPDTRQKNPALALPENNGRLLLEMPEGREAAGNMAVALWDGDHFLHPYFEALRDRVMTFFDANNLTHNPKLVAVTGCAKGAGVTTIAAGLAATLSETGEGNVLLVDMNLGQGAAHPFYKGKPACSLDEALTKKDAALVQDNLYVVAEGMKDNKTPDVLPNRLARLVPKLRASEYDYIIFDMPPVSQISVTTKLSRLMDVNLMVVESEKTALEVVKQASHMISGSKANVGVVLNKKRSYVPQWLHQEL